MLHFESDVPRFFGKQIQVNIILQHKVVRQIRIRAFVIQKIRRASHVDAIDKPHVSSVHAYRDFRRVHVRKIDKIAV